jgi:hypothetical protein
METKLPLFVECIEECQWFGEMPVSLGPVIAEEAFYNFSVKKKEFHKVILRFHGDFLSLSKV